MEIKLKLYKPFVTELNRLRDKYGEKVAGINGFANYNLNFTDFIDNFTEADTIADATIDPNANSNNKDITTLERDMVKPHKKLLSYNKIFYEMVKKFGLEDAQAWLNAEYIGAIFLHDAVDSSLKPYCYAYSLKDLVNKGLYFMKDGTVEPAKHLDTFNRHVLNFISYTSNRTNGAKFMAQ